MCSWGVGQSSPVDFLRLKVEVHQLALGSTLLFVPSKHLSLCFWIPWRPAGTRTDSFLPCDLFCVTHDLSPCSISNNVLYCQSHLRRVLLHRNLFVHIKVQLLFLRSSFNIYSFPGCVISLEYLSIYSRLQEMPRFRGNFPCSLPYNSLYHIETQQSSLHERMWHLTQNSTRLWNGPGQSEPLQQVLWGQTLSAKLGAISPAPWLPHSFASIMSAVKACKQSVTIPSFCWGWFKWFELIYLILLIRELGALLEKLFLIRCVIFLPLFRHLSHGEKAEEPWRLL